MIGFIVVAAVLLQAPQQGPKSLDVDPSKIQPPLVVPSPIWQAAMSWEPR